MTEQLTNLALLPLRDLISDDSYVMTFQTVGQYRTALLQHADFIATKQAKVETVKLERATQLDDGYGEENE